MAASVTVTGLEARQGETAFAFVVMRLRAPIDRNGLVKLVRFIAPLVAGADELVDGLPPAFVEAVVVVAVPWAPPEAGHGVDSQRRLIEGAGAVGVEAAWFFQTGTSLRADDEDEEDEDDDDDASDVGEETIIGAALTDEGLARVDVIDRTDEAWSSGEIDVETEPVPKLDDENEDVPRTRPSRAVTETIESQAYTDAVQEDEDATWLHGPPPQVASVRFPVDGYPAIVDELDWEDFGIAFKLAGTAVPGEATVLLGFHALWLAPYQGRYRNCSVTFDRTHHAAHLWVDRFAVPCSAEEQVRHLLWVASKIDEVFPIVHARFGGATMAQKYGGLLGNHDEPFVLGGNPLVAVHASGGEPAVDAWIAEASVWSKPEIAQMLREIAIEIVTAGSDDDAEADVDGEPVDAVFEANAHDEHEDDSGDEDQNRHIASHAAELLKARARAGMLDRRAAESLLPILSRPDKFEHRRCAVVEILGAMRYRPAVPELIRILDQTTIKSSLDSIGKDDLVTSTAAALGALGDPAAIPALTKVVTAPGAHNDDPRVAAADALATCLAAGPEPRDIGDAVLLTLLETIEERDDGEINVGTHLAYGRIARVLDPGRRAEAARLLADTRSARDDATAILARHAALALAGTTAQEPPAELRGLLHTALTTLDYDHEATVCNLRVALRIAEVLPELVDPADVLPLTRFSEADLRAKAHALLDTLGRGMPPAAMFGAAAARALDDRELVRLIAEPNVVGRAALVAEAGRRELVSARRAIVDACQDVIVRARRGSANLLDPDRELLEAAVKALCAQPLSVEAVTLFDRMLRSPNFHVKWELLQTPPNDPRLLGGMFHVLGQRWGWQQETAKQWLSQFAGTDGYEAARASAVPDDPDEDSEPHGRASTDVSDADVPDDEQMN